MDVNHYQNFAEVSTVSEYSYESEENGSQADDDSTWECVDWKNGSLVSMCYADDEDSEDPDAVEEDSEYGHYNSLEYEDHQAAQIPGGPAPNSWVWRYGLAPESLSDCGLNCSYDESPQCAAAGGEELLSYRNAPFSNSQGWVGNLQTIDEEKPVSILLCGLSFLDRCYTALERNQLPNQDVGPSHYNLLFGFDEDQVAVTWYRTPGGHLFFYENNWDNIIEENPATIVIFELGSNDLCASGLVPLLFATRLHEFIGKVLETEGVEVVGLTGVFRRERMGVQDNDVVEKVETYNSRVAEFNTFMKNYMESDPRTFYWEHDDRLTGPRARPFCWDGVHLEDAKLACYYNSWRGAIVKALLMRMDMVKNECIRRRRRRGGKRGGQKHKRGRPAPGGPTDPARRHASRNNRGHWNGERS